MNATARPARKPRDLQRSGLFLCDAEIARRLGVSGEKFRTIVSAFGPRGFPPRDAVVGTRYWPAVKAFFDRRYGVDTVSSSLTPDGEDNLDAYR
jgi:hypothetical protein